MATTIYRECLKAFWRTTENLDVTITAASPDTFSPAPSRFTSAVTFDAFWKASLEIMRVLKRLPEFEIARIVPTLISEENIALSAGGVGTITKKWDFLFTEQYVVKSAVKQMAKRVDPITARYIIAQTTGRLAPSAENAFYDILQSGSTYEVYVYPTATYGSGNIYLRGILAPDRLISSNGNYDIFPQGLSDIWIDAAVAIATGESGELSVSNLIYQKLQTKFQLQTAPVVKNIKGQELFK